MISNIRKIGNKYVILNLKNFTMLELGLYLFKYAALLQLAVKNDSLVYCNEKKLIDIFPNIKYNKLFPSCTYVEDVNDYSPIRYITGISIKGNFFNIKYFDKIYKELQTNLKPQEHYDIFKDYVYVYIGPIETYFLNKININYYIDAIKKNGLNKKYIFYVNSKYIYISDIIKKKINIDMKVYNDDDILNIYSIFYQASKVIIPNSLLLWWACYLTHQNKKNIYIPLNWLNKEHSLYYKINIPIPNSTIIKNKIYDEESFLSKYIIEKDDFYKKKCVKPYLNPKDGLGSNMFTIATAYALAKENKCDIIINKQIPFHVDKEYKELPVNICDLFPNIDCTDKNILYPNRFVEHYPSNTISKITYKTGIELFGWFRSYKYFHKYQKQLIKLFDFSDKIKEYTNKKYNKYFDKYNSIIGIHIRRGDYKVVHFIQPMTDIYYINALKKLIKNKYNNPFVFIFVQDDESIEWLSNSDFMALFKSNFNNYIFVKDNPYVTMYIMTLCNFLIIANSSYSYMGAFLNNKNPIVYCPYLWYNNLESNYKLLQGIEKYLYPLNWNIIKF